MMSINFDVQLRMSNFAAFRSKQPVNAHESIDQQFWPGSISSFVRDVQLPPPQTRPPGPERSDKASKTAQNCSAISHGQPVQLPPDTASTASINCIE